jgi:YVTN family beta-propeller protein
MLESMPESGRSVSTARIKPARRAFLFAAAAALFGSIACSSDEAHRERSPTTRDLAAPLEPSDPNVTLPVVLPQQADPLLTGLTVPADAAVRGLWSSTKTWPLNGLHSVLLPNGRVLTYGTPTGAAGTQNGRYYDVWDPAQGFVTTSHRTSYSAQQADSFCSSAAFLASGTLMVSGGNAPLASTEFSPATAAIAASPSAMADERWYGSMIVLADGRLLMLGGSTPYGALRAYQDPAAAVNNGSISMTPEIYEPGTGFRSLFGAYSREAFGPDHHRYWYPRAWAAPNGEVFGISSEKMWFLNTEGAGSIRVAGDFKTPVDATARPNIGPTSTAVMFAPGRILQVGGNGYHDGHATPSSALATVVDINGAEPVLSETAAMSFARQWANSTVLPDGRVVVTGGTRNANDGGANAVYEAELWDPTTGTWTIGARAAQIRVYHSAAILLPNGTVLSTGGGAPGPVNNLNAEIYYPPYLFRTTSGGGAELAPRPELTAVSSLSLAYGQTLDADLLGTPAITKAVLIGASTVTHSFNTFQRRVELEFLQTDGRLAIGLPADRNLAPPGYYTLFVVDENGVPSSGVLLSLGEGVAAPPVSTLLPRGNEITLRSWNLPDYGVATDASALGILKLLGATPSDADLASARFTVRDGLADSNCISLESVAAPGQWLRHYGYRLRLSANDGADVFKNDATFCPEPGLSGTGFSFRSKNFPLRVIRHRNGELWIDEVTTTGTFAADATFTLGPAPLPTIPSIAAPIVPAGTPVSYAPAVAVAGAEYSWDFGDGSLPEGASATPAATHTFADPGVYLVTFTLRLADGRSVTKTFVQAVRGAIAPGSARTSSAVALEPQASGTPRVWVVNPDNDSVAVFDGATLTRVREITVGTSPRSVAVAPDGRVWVVNRGTGTISIVNPATFAVASTIAFARGSEPHGLVFAPNAAFAYVSLEATGRVVELDATTGAPRRSLDVGASPRGLAITPDGARLLVSRFITPPLPGESGAAPVTDAPGAELRVVPLPDFASARSIGLLHSNRSDGPIEGRGIPNYLAAPVISPDGLSAFVPSKQDNVARGTLRDGSNLDFQNSVRAVSSRVDLGLEAELVEERVDHDNAGVASAAAFHPSGVYLFVALETSRQVAVVDGFDGTELFRIEVGRAPQGLVVSSDGTRLFVQNFMDRTLSALDLSPLVAFGEFRTTALGSPVSVGTEKLAANVLLGKQLFYDARDPRLARDAYLSCASCHADGKQDGRVWDFTGMGEGVRNTVSLVGRAGAQGFLHWSGNFDEVQDFEGQIRAFAGGSGLMSEADFTAGTRSQPLGDPKAGRSADLDALAAYLKSLTAPSPSPYRTSSGLTTAAANGRSLFSSHGCASCHYGSTFSDEAGTGLKDIGTLKDESGARLFGPLTGIDVPTLRDAWTTAPYLHDGSAATITDAIVAHDGVTLTAAELADVAEFVRQIDGSEPAVARVSCSDGIKNGSETGVDCGGSCSACPACAPANYEAETMYHSTGGSTSGGWNIWSNGYVSTQHAFGQGATTITVYARGSVAANVWPNMRVLVGGVVLGNVAVNTTSYRAYSFSYAANAGSAEIRVQFTNDLNQNGQDRNLYVDRVSITCGSTPAPTCSDGLKNGTETGVDCGGSCSTRCANGSPCVVNADCSSNACVASVCQAAAGSLTARINYLDNWGSGYCAEIVITNGTTSTVDTWTATLDLNQANLTSSWNGTFTGSGELRTVTPLSWNARLAPGGTASPAYCADVTGSNSQPTVTVR